MPHSITQFLDKLSDKELIQRFDKALEGCNLGVWDWDMRDNSVQFDRRWCEMLGLDHDHTRMELSTWTERVHPDDIKKCYDDIKNYLDGKTRYYENIHRMKHASGEWIYILDRGRISGWDSENKPIRFTGTHYDVTIVENAKRALQAQTDLLIEMISNLPNAVCMVDSKMRYLAASKLWISDYKLKYPDVIGKSHYEIFSDIPERWKEIHANALKGYPAHSEHDIFHREAGDTIHLKWDVRPWHTGTGEIGGLIMMSEDITEKIQIQAKTINESKLAALGQMAGAIAHEINTPLQVILSNSERLNNELTKRHTHNEVTEKCLNRISDTTLKISKIVKGLKTIARDQTNDPIEIFSLEDVVNDVLALSQRRLVNDEVRVSTVYDKPNIQPLGRAGEVGQILLNLISNSIDAISNSQQKWIKLSAVCENKLVKIRVSDSGNKISPVIQSKLMTPFFTTKEVGKGSGLGLSVSKALAENMKGSLNYLPNEISTTFELQLPLS